VRFGALGLKAVFLLGVRFGAPGLKAVFLLGVRFGVLGLGACFISVCFGVLLVEARG